MKAIYWRIRSLNPLAVNFWTKKDESNMLHTWVASISEADIKARISEMTGVQKFMLIRREKEPKNG